MTIVLRLDFMINFPLYQKQIFILVRKISEEQFSRSEHNLILVLHNQGISFKFFFHLSITCLLVCMQKDPWVEVLFVIFEKKTYYIRYLE